MADWMKIYEEAEQESLRSLKKTVARIKSRQAQTSLQAGTGTTTMSNADSQQDVSKAEAPQETCHYLLSTPDGEQMGVSGSQLSAFLTKYGSEEEPENSKKQP